MGTCESCHAPERCEYCCSPAEIHDPAMKTLTLMRHAKSSWKNPGLPDHMRPLNKRGRRDAPMMGRRLAEQGPPVELIVSSPAVRALETAEAMAQEMEYPWDEIATDDDLYEADGAEILMVIERQDDWIDHLMLIGHNPGLTELVNTLARLGVENVPTSGVVRLSYDVGHWGQISEVEPARVTFDYPKRRSG